MHLGPKKVSFSESPYFHHCTGHKDSDVRNHIIMTIYTIPTFPTTDFDLKQLNLWSWRYGCFKQGTRREVNLLFTISNLLLERQHWWNITGHDRDMLIVALAYYQHYLGIQFPFRTWRDRSYIMGHEKRDDGDARYLWHLRFFYFPYYHGRETSSLWSWRDQSAKRDLRGTAIKTIYAFHAFHTIS